MSRVTRWFALTAMFGTVAALPVIGAILMNSVWGTILFGLAMGIIAGTLLKREARRRQVIAVSLIRTSVLVATIAAMITLVVTFYVRDLLEINRLIGQGVAQLFMHPTSSPAVLLLSAFSREKTGHGGPFGYAQNLFNRSPTAVKLWLGTCLITLTLAYVIVKGVLCEPRCPRCERYLPEVRNVAVTPSAFRDPVVTAVLNEDLPAVVATVRAADDAGLGSTCLIARSLRCFDCSLLLIDVIQKHYSASGNRIVSVVRPRAVSEAFLAAIKSERAIPLADSPSSPASR